MKKGLRPRDVGGVEGDAYSNRRPDEEGIKTHSGSHPSLHQTFQPQT